MSGDFRPTRRAVLLVGVAIPILGFTGTPSANPVAASSAASSNDGADLSRFLAFSRFATGNDQLDPDVGRLLWFNLNRSRADFPAQFGALDRKRSTLDSPQVEDLAASIAAGPLHSVLIEIIRGWYTGSVRTAGEVKVFAFETALMYQPTRDRIVIPTFAYNGPDYWASKPKPEGTALQPTGEDASALRNERAE